MTDTDNTELNRGSGGDNISTDVIGVGADCKPIKVQRVKVQYGDDGEATDVSKINPLPVKSTILTAANELSVAENTPLTQISAQYGLGQNVFTLVDSSASGTTTASDGKFICQTGTDPAGLAIITTLRELTFRPGQGIVARFSSLYTTPGQADSRQTAGLINAENGFSFGLFEDTFGIIYSHDGQVEHQELTITTPASGSETATVTVNGTGFSVPLTAGTVQHNAIEIADSLTTQVSGYRFTANDDQVVALAFIPGPGGSFAFSSSTAIAAWVRIKAGVDLTFEPVIEQSNWNIDPMGDFTFDLTTLNYFQIKYTYAGVLFSVVNNEGEIRDVHFITGVNQSDKPLVTTLSFRVGWACRNVGNTSNLTIAGSSASGFVEGAKRFDSGLNASDTAALSIGTASTTVLVIRNRISFGGRINRAELLPRFISASTQTNKTAFFELIFNPTFSSDLVFDYFDKEGSIAEISKDNVLVTGGKLIGAVNATAGSPQDQNFNDEPNTDTFVPPGATLALVARVSSGAASDMEASMSWQEDI